MMQTVSGTLTRLERRPNSRDGNPTWRLHLDTYGSVTTKRDAQVGHLISPGWEGDLVRLTLDGRGQVTHAERVAR